jgi:hypothetical protein
MDGRSVFMNMRFPAVLVVGFVAGLTGGVASHFLTPEKRSELRTGPIRATRIELVDEAGKTRAFLGTDNERDTALVFLDDHSLERAKFGVWPNVYSPKLVMRGEDGKERIRFHLSAVDDRPIIVLGDHERNRVELGYHQNDTATPDEAWSLVFYGPHTDDKPPFYGNPLTESGIFQDYKSKQMGGFFYFRGKDGSLHEPK